LYQTRLHLNQATDSGEYGPAQRALLDRADVAAARAEIAGWPGYDRTPLLIRDAMAADAGVAAVWCKHEGYRFGIGSFKPTGPTYAMLNVLKNEVRKAVGVEPTTRGLLDGEHAQVAGNVVVTAATSGNHGRALAWGARTFGCRAVIYMNEEVSAGRARAIAGFGAEVVRVPGSFDAAVHRCSEDATARGWLVISDYPSPDYPEVPRVIMQGYAVVAAEICEQLAEPPTHLFVPGGGGVLAGGICGCLWERLGSNRPRIVLVEPDASRCLYESARAGSMARVPSAASIMDGLVVEEPSAAAWPLVRGGAFAFLAVEDQAAVDAMRQAAHPPDGDPPAVIGDTGSAAWAGFLAATADPDLRRHLGLDATSRVVIIATEAATDPEVYRRIVGVGPETVSG